MMDYINTLFFPEISLTQSFLQLELSKCSIFSQLIFELRYKCANILSKLVLFFSPTACKIKEFPTIVFLQEQHFLCQFVNFVLILQLAVKKAFLKWNFLIEVCQIYRTNSAKFSENYHPMKLFKYAVFPALSHSNIFYHH